MEVLIVIFLALFIILFVLDIVGSVYYHIIDSFDQQRETVEKLFQFSTRHGDLLENAQLEWKRRGLFYFPAISLTFKRDSDAPLDEEEE